jgi:xanthine/CO dehydrogenase XdhC/CoxF family maturation factor
MSEFREIVAALDAGWDRGEKMALATIVAVSGSTYRREGAKLLVYESGKMVGNVSGGCLEGDIAVVADEVMRDGTPRLASYDLTADDDLVWGLGLGCNGKVEVFVELVDLGLVEHLFLEPMRAAIDGERTVIMPVVIRGTEHVPSGTRKVWVPEADEHTLEWPGGFFNLQVEEWDRFARAMEAARLEGHSRRAVHATAEGDLDVFIEVLQPPIRLVVCGAGHDAIPVVVQAVGLGWRVVVTDKRDAFLTQDRFPGAAFLKASFADAGAQIPVDGRTAVLVMTHNYLNDRDLLRGLLTRHAPLPFYIGMLGPRARTEKILEDLAAEGLTPSADAQARLHGPVGLDLGSEGPEEIALAALAEILAVDRARSAGFLRERPGPIHASVTP